MKDKEPWDICYECPHFDRYFGRKPSCKEQKTCERIISEEEDKLQEILKGRVNTFEQLAYDRHKIKNRYDLKATLQSELEILQQLLKNLPERYEKNEIKEIPEKVKIFIKETMKLHEKFSRMEDWEVNLSLKYLTDITELKRQGKTETEIQAILDKKQQDYLKELKEIKSKKRRMLIKEW